MIRRHLRFRCENVPLVATIDVGHRRVGLLLVSGGNEPRAGAFDGQAKLARKLANNGYTVMRFDRRGVGDSEGENGGFLTVKPDIAAALARFRKEIPGLERIVGFGNCDAASALMLNPDLGFDALVLSNPWTFEEGDEDAAPPAAAIRGRYAQKLANPKEIWRLMTGKVNLKKLARGMKQAMIPAPGPGTLATRMRDGLDGFGGNVSILLSENDRTAQAFAAIWPKDDPRIARCAGAGHAYAQTEARQWLYQQIASALAKEEARQFNMG